IKRIYNTISISHGCYSREIVIVISGAGVLAHIRTALITPVNLTSNKNKVQALIGHNKHL
ncbi:hypothetical protein, partial [Klebsiella michiganensis]|uniref:hypothetical protein n=1 Tax=Klebsiella michiganensis TaxID=1134687 RepID=UPI0025A08CC0